MNICKHIQYVSNRTKIFEKEKHFLNIIFFKYYYFYFIVTDIYFTVIYIFTINSKNSTN